MCEHRRCHVTLAVTGMLPREIARSARADRAHRKMNGAAPQSRGEPFSTDVCAPKRGLENGVIIRQHADDDTAVEQVGDIGRGPEAECRELVHPVRAPDIGGYPTPPPRPGSPPPPP